MPEPGETSRKRSLRTSWAPRALFLAGTALVLGPLAASACSSAPSSEVDAGDLLGVFDRDASAPPGDAGTKKRAKKEKDGGVAVEPVSKAEPRAPAPGFCIRSEGSPERDIRRTEGRPACRDAQILEWRDAEGSPRYACVYAPKGVEAKAPLPVVLFFHGGADEPPMVDKKTMLRKHLNGFNLSGDPARPGFIVIAVQGRNIRGGKEGAIFDTEYTDATNVDILATDHFFREVESRKLVDAQRVYTLGADHGGKMAATYAMARADRIAAFATFAAAAPRAAWSCPGSPPPGLVLYRACDAFASCDSVERWLRAREGLGAETVALRLGAVLDEEPNCAMKNRCSVTKGTNNHRRWPKGREEDILRFFARHALGRAEGPDRGKSDEGAESTP